MRKLTFLAGLVLASSSSAQLAITEIMLDPLGPNIGNQKIELTNIGNAPMAISGWNLCVAFSCALLPNMTIQPGQIVVCHVAATGTDTANDVFLPGLSPLDISSDVAVLYQSSQFENFQDIVDYVSWGGSTVRAQLAFLNQQWPGPGATVPGPFVEGHSLAWTIPTSGLFGASFMGNGPESWFDDATPTIGVAGGDTIQTVGTSCQTSGGSVFLFVPTAAVDGNLDFSLRAHAGPAGSPVAILAGLPSGGLPFLGCSVEVSTVFIALAGVLSGSGIGFGAFGVSLPLNVPNVGGSQVMFQALVVDSGAPNGAFGMSSGKLVTFGF